MKNNKKSEMKRPKTVAKSASRKKTKKSVSSVSKKNTNTLLNNRIAQSEYEERSREISKHILKHTLQLVENRFGLQWYTAIQSPIEQASRRMPLRMWQTLVLTWMDRCKNTSFENAQSILQSFSNFCSHPIPQEPTMSTPLANVALNGSTTTTSTRLKNNNNEPSLYICRQCKARGVDIECQMLQTRRADEPMTQFLTCLKCNYKWRQQ